MAKKMEPQTRYINPRENLQLTTNSALQLPPQALDLEEAVLGAAIVDKSCLEALMSFVTMPEVFYLSKHQDVFQAIQSLFNAGSVVDLMTLRHELIKQQCLEKIGGIFFLTEITDKVSQTHTIEFHLKILYEFFLRRSLIGFAHGLIKDCYDSAKDVFDTMDRAQLYLDSIRNSFVKSPIRDGSQLVLSTLEMTELAMMQKGLSGVNTGLKSLNAIFGGWQNTDLIILAARPSMGKTGVALGLARNAFLSGNAVGVFSMEMSAEQMMMRLVSAELYHHHNAVISTSEIKRGKLSKEQFKLLHEASAIYATKGLIIDDSAGLSLQELRSRAITMKTRYGIKVLFIDYLQLMSCKAGSREQEISAIARGLKNLAKELKIPIIALSQLSRQVEGRGDKRPVLADLRESGEIEQAADIVAFLYRPEYYKIFQDEQGHSTENVTEFIVKKHRNGSLDDIPIFYLPMCSAIKDSHLYQEAIVRVPVGESISITNSAQTAPWDN